MAFINQPWEQTIRNGIPPLVVVRPIPGSSLGVGDPYRIVNPANKREVMRARQYYEQRRISPASQPAAPAEKETSKDGTKKRKAGH